MQGTCLDHACVLHCVLCIEGTKEECVEWKEFDSLGASSVSAKIKQMFLNQILIQVMGDVIKNGKGVRGSSME